MPIQRKRIRARYCDTACSIGVSSLAKSSRVTPSATEAFARSPLWPHEAQGARPPRANSAWPINNRKIEPRSSLPAAFHRLPPDKQNEVLREAGDAKPSCEDNRVMRQYQDCACIAEKFVEARIAAGSDMSANTLMSRISEACPNPPSIAKHEKGRCLEVMRYSARYDSGDLEKFYSCVGDTVADTYAAAPTSELQRLVHYHSEAQMACGRAELDKRRK